MFPFLSTCSILTVSIFFGIVYINIYKIAHESDKNYGRIILSKDLIADILPPPMYIVEAYLICNELYFENDKAKHIYYFEKLKNLKNDYYERRNFWTETEDDKEIRTLLLEKSYNPVAEFYDIVLNKYIPAVQNNERDKITNLLINELKPRYLNHRAYIDDLVNYSNNKNEQILETSQREIKSSIFNTIVILILVALVLIGLIIFLSMVISSSITKPLNEAIQMAEDIAKGKF